MKSGPEREQVKVGEPLDEKSDNTSTSNCLDEPPPSKKMKSTPEMEPTEVVEPLDMKSDSTNCLDEPPPIETSEQESAEMGKKITRGNSCYVYS